MTVDEFGFDVTDTCNCQWTDIREGEECTFICTLAEGHEGSHRHGLDAVCGDEEPVGFRPHSGWRPKRERVRR